LNYVDIILLVLLAVPTFIGLTIGLIRAVLSLVGLILGIILAGQFYESLSGALSFISNEDVAKGIAFILILLAVIIIVSIIARLLSSLASAMLLGWVNRIGGAVFGFLMGVLVLAAILATWVNFFGSDAITDSFIAAVLLDKLPLILNLLPEEFDAIRDFFQ
jgi:membrane protein required for colicin V production